MLLTHPSQISEIDKYAKQELGIPVLTLMERAGRAVANAVRAYLQKGCKVAIFAGKGNNGGDGYAAALELMSDYKVTVYDVFSAGQRSDEGRHFLGAFTSVGGVVEPLEFSDEQLQSIRSSACIIDAVFGTGVASPLPKIATRLTSLIASLEDTVKIAVDLPLGVNAADGTVIKEATYRADATVVLGFIKTGLVSYPAKEYVGKLIYDNIGLQNDSIIERFAFNDHYIDRSLAASLVPKREANTSKGSFGKLLMMSGSREYRGAACLSLEAALRSGVGYVTFAGEPELCDTLLLKLPEAIYKHIPKTASLDSSDVNYICSLSAKHTATLIGCGSSVSEGLFVLLERLLSEEGSPLILDADAINVLAEKGDRGRALIRNARRRVILTPHPLELSRLSGISTEAIQNNRYSVATEFARQHNCVLVLKGAATIVTDGTATYINSSGSSALAKAGSGDVLAGALASLVASGSEPLSASALAVYLHGLAADVLSKSYSELGVMPSDLPREMARQFASLLKEKTI